MKYSKAIQDHLYEALRLIAESKSLENKYDKYDAMGYVKIARQAIAKAEGDGNDNINNQL